MPVLQIIIGSTRPVRSGEPVAQWFADLARADGRFEVELVDLKEVGLPLLDEPNHPRLQQYTQPHTHRWSEIVSRADAVPMPRVPRGARPPGSRCCAYAARSARGSAPG
ncbi:NAD(P)H-dependent oxidoreductase [Kutzneria sp. NPDC051319]|uniref:NADPH-dependent FMN reductase n=1 Tax=Kutzneria sp. NPDC051319 TaxID=3155047 RepID=UPI00343408FC